MLKPLLISLGSVSLVLGIVGIAVPGIPTTPFLLQGSPEPWSWDF